MGMPPLDSDKNIVIFKDVSFKPLIGEQELRHVNLSIKKGETLGIIGDVHSGKELLIQCMNRIVPEYIAGRMEGSVTVCGADIKDKQVCQVAQNVGIVFRNPITQTLGVTVEEDVAFGPVNLGLPRKEIMDRINYSLTAVRLNGFEKRNPNSLSGGEAQSLAIADLMAMRPQVLAMIEPIAMLDPVGGERVYSVIEQLRKDYGITFVITDSGANIEDLAEHADRLAYIDLGENKFEGTPDEVLQEELVSRTVGIPQVTELFLRLRKLNRKLAVPSKLSDAITLLKKELRGKRVTPDVVKKATAKAAKPIGESIIKVRNLKHTYPAVPEPIEALGGIDFDIHKGEIIALLGQNGAGKTTLALHLVGLLQATNPDAEINISGIDIVKFPERATEVINYVFQNPGDQLFNETPWEEIAWGLKQRKIPEDEINRKVEESIKQFDLEKYAKEFVVAIPDGVKTRVAAASTMVLNPSILIVDEPTGGLDSVESGKMLGILSDINKEGRTIIVITHDMRLAAKYADRLIVLVKGKIVADGNTRDVLSKPELLRQASLMPPQITRLGQALEEFGMPKDVLTVEEMSNILERTLHT